MAFRFSRILRSYVRSTGISGSRQTKHYATLPEVSTVKTSSAITLQENLLQEEEVLQHEDYFGVRNLVTVEDLYKAKVHLGHKMGSRNPNMTPYIIGTRLGIDIIDLDQTVPLLGDALNFAAHIAYRQGIILFCSRHFQTLLEVEKTATECGEYSHCREWKGGTFTNATIQYGLVTRLPDLCLFMSTHNTIFEQHIGIVEIAKMNIPSIGILDTSCDPSLITYPVPGNDDSPQAVRLYCNLFTEAILKGKQKAKEHQDVEQT